MTSIAAWQNDDEKENASVTANKPELSPAQRITNLKELAFKLLHEVESITEIQTLNIDQGLDFYGEVQSFEIELIKRALLRTAGHQGRAARLLNLKVTTLNSKIKHYQIDPTGFAVSYPVMDRSEPESRQHA